MGKLLLIIVLAIMALSVFGDLVFGIIGGVLGGLIALIVGLFGALIGIVAGVGGAVVGVAFGLAGLLLPFLIIGLVIVGVVTLLKAL